MTLQETNTVIVANENDAFPVGMRVLAVDDNLTCLKLLERILKQCQYEVTTTLQAKVALEMVKESRNRFDIIICDVHMPDMNGFELLELVGLEMDLPVIMLSSNSDRELVMEGVKHGACDYLVKPVRKEELNNIWQHVIRRRKKEVKQQSLSNSYDKDQQANGECGKESCSKFNSDQNGKRLNRERKDKVGTKKKPRVVWSQDLHAKFVTAVHQLGPKAPPKRILKHMNVDGLTNQNVASHKQKYKRGLKRICLPPETSIVSAEGVYDPYMRMYLFDGVRDLSLLNPYSPLLIQANNQLISKPLELNHLQPSKSTSVTGDNNFVDSSVKYLPSAQINIVPTTQTGEIFANQDLESINASMDLNNSNDGVFSNFSSTSSAYNDSLIREMLTSKGIEKLSTPSGHILNNSLVFSSTDIISTSIHDSIGEGLFGNFENTENVVPVKDVINPFEKSFKQNNSFFQRNMQRFQNSSFGTLHSKLDLDTRKNQNGDYILEQWSRSQNGFAHNRFDAVDNFLNSVTRGEQEGNMVKDGEFGIDAYNFGSFYESR